MNRPIALIVEDEPALADALAQACEAEGFSARLAHSGARALALLQETPPNFVLLDIGLPDCNGIDVLRHLRKTDTTTPVLVLTAHGNLENAVEATRNGANAYLVKPAPLAELQRRIRQLTTLEAAEFTPAQPPPQAQSAPPILVGSAPAMQQVFIEIAHACASDVPVLITGPSGIGKTLAARAIHYHSARTQGPFVTLQCASLPETLLESELFGHERGAFTGAIERREGHLERARGGTLFLDEIGDIPPATQAKLLRFVEERTFARLGGREDLQIDLRIIAATNRDLRALVATGNFREDLFYRLHVLEIRLPSLAERIEDLPALCAYFLQTAAHKRSLRLSAASMEILRHHGWPGNLRELRNALEHAAAVCPGSLILPQHLPRELRASIPPADTEQALRKALRKWMSDRADGKESYETLHNEVETLLLEELLHLHGGRPTRLAAALDINRTTLRKRLRKKPASDA